MAQPAYLVIGHQTQDVQEPNSTTVSEGGTVLFAAREAERLGWQAAIVTAVSAAANRSTVPGVLWHARTVAHSTRFCNQATAHGRVQRLLAQAEPLRAVDIPSAWLPSPLWHLAPVAQELTPDLLSAAAQANRMVGITPQGLLRQWSEAGWVGFCPWPAAAQYLPHFQAAVLSIADVANDWQYIAHLASLISVLVVTQGEQGATVFVKTVGQHVPPPRAHVGIDVVGAGDTFAAAFFCEFFLTRDALRAAAFANLRALSYIDTIIKISTDQKVA